MGDNISDILFERVFKATDTNGVVETITLCFGKPYLTPDLTSNPMWRCPYQIIGIGSQKVHEGHGVDALDALLVSIKLAEILLISNAKSYKKTITWLDEEHLGLSTPEISKNTTQPEWLDAEDNPFKKVFDDFFNNRD